MSARSQDEASEWLWMVCGQQRGRVCQKPQLEPGVGRGEGPSPAGLGRPGDGHMPGIHGPCPATSKLVVTSKRPPRRTHKVAL